MEPKSSPAPVPRKRSSLKKTAAERAKAASQSSLLQGAYTEPYAEGAAGSAGGTRQRSASVSRSRDLLNLSRSPRSRSRDAINQVIDPVGPTQGQ